MAVHSDASVTRLRREKAPADVHRPKRRPLTRWLRILVPGIGLLLAALVIIWPALRETEVGFTLSFTDVTNFDDRLRMEALRFEGTDTHGRPFVVTAERASQIATGQAAIELENVEASVTLPNDLWLNLEALKGEFDDQEERLTLEGEVSLYSSLGYEVHASDVVMDLTTSTAHSDNNVYGQGPLGRFDGGSFTTDLKTERVRLEDGVRMTIYPKGTVE